MQHIKELADETWKDDGVTMLKRWQGRIQKDYVVRGISTVYKNAEVEEMNAASKRSNVSETLTLIN